MAGIRKSSRKKEQPKRWYNIYVSGESEGSCRRELTQEEYELIYGIMEDTASHYCNGSIYPVATDDEIKKLAHDYRMHCAMKYEIPFKQFYEENHWNYRVYDEVVKRMEQLGISIK